MIEIGVPLFDYLTSRDTIWVYLPTEDLDGHWRCDLMIMCEGEVTQAKRGLIYSNRYLSSLETEAPCLR